MKTSNFRHDVQIEIEFTKEELDLINECMQAHYDLSICHSARQGGFFYGWMNRFEMCGPAFVCDSEQLSCCGKALEIFTSISMSLVKRDISAKLQREIKEALQKIATEYDRVNKKAQRQLTRLKSLNLQGMGYEAKIAHQRKIDCLEQEERDEREI